MSLWFKSVCAWFHPAMIHAVWNVIPTDNPEWWLLSYLHPPLTGLWYLTYLCVCTHVCVRGGRETPAGTFLEWHLQLYWEEKSCLVSQMQKNMQQSKIRNSKISTSCIYRSSDTPCASDSADRKLSHVHVVQCLMVLFTLVTLLSATSKLSYMLNQVLLTFFRCQQLLLNHLPVCSCSDLGPSPALRLHVLFFADV